MLGLYFIIITWSQKMSWYSMGFSWNYISNNVKIISLSKSLFLHNANKEWQRKNRYGKLGKLDEAGQRTSVQAANKSDLLFTQPELRGVQTLSVFLSLAQLDVHNHHFLDSDPICWILGGLNLACLSVSLYQCIYVKSVDGSI